MQFLLSKNTVGDVQTVAETAPALCSRALAAKDDFWTVELYRDYWNTTNVRFLRNGVFHAFGILSARPRCDHPALVGNVGPRDVSTYYCRILNEIALTMQEVWVGIHPEDLDPWIQSPEDGCVRCTDKYMGREITKSGA